MMQQQPDYSPYHVLSLNSIIQSRESAVSTVVGGLFAVYMCAVPILPARQVLSPRVALHCRIAAANRLSRSIAVAEYS